MNCSSTEQPPLYSVTFKSTTSIILSKKILIERSNKIEREREREREREKTKLKRNEWELEFRKIMNY